MTPRTNRRNNSSAVAVVAVKEMRDGLRDKRSLMSSLLFPLVGPAMIAFMFIGLIERSTANEALELPVIGGDHAPGLLEHLAQHDVEIVDPPADAEEAVRRGEINAVLVIPEDYAEDFRGGRPARVELLVDDSRRENEKVVRQLRQRLDAYTGSVAMLRLMARGVHPEVVQPLVVDEIDLATPERHAANLLNIVPGFVMLAAFMGGMFIATDSTAGERERKSLEPLLLNPVARAALVLGKWLATTAFGLTSLLLTLIGSVVALRMVPLQDLGLVLTFDGIDLLLGIAALAPLAPMAASLELLVATFARSFREAQTYLSLLVFVPMMPGVYLSVEPLESAMWMFSVPVLGSQMLVFDILRGEPVAWTSYVLVAVSNALLAAVALLATTRLFSRERIMFG